MKIVDMNAWLHGHYLMNTDKVNIEELIRRSNFAKYGRRRL